MSCWYKLCLKFAHTSTILVRSVTSPCEDRVPAINQAMTDSPLLISKQTMGQRAHIKELTKEPVCSRI